MIPITISRFRNGGDECTAKLLETVVYPEEITHCAAGVKWFKYLCHRTLGSHQDSALTSDGLSLQTPTAREDLSKQEQVGCRDGNGSVEHPEIMKAADTDLQGIVIRTFHSIVRRYFRGPLKPPFNVEARKAAGFEPEWYEPLAAKEGVV